MTTDRIAEAVLDELRRIASELADLRVELNDIAYTLRESSAGINEIRDALVQIQSDHQPK